MNQASKMKPLFFKPKLYKRQTFKNSVYSRCNNLNPNSHNESHPNNEPNQKANNNHNNNSENAHYLPTLGSANYNLTLFQTKSKRA